MAMNGNMAAVYRAALREAGLVSARDGPFAAQIIPTCSASWHLVQTVPSREPAAAWHLAERQFGIYLPVFGRDGVLAKSGPVRAGKPLFPGYLFVFVWDVMAHWRRITECPGVARIVMEAARPVVVPDSVIDDIQVLEALNGELKDGCRAGRRGWRRRRRPTVAATLEVLTISTGWSMNGLDDLDDGARIGVLHRALGLASNAPAAVPCTA
jgi:transcription antitermination factor NusG